jgi:hypothetical protein
MRMLIKLTNPLGSTDTATSLKYKLATILGISEAETERMINMGQYDIDVTSDINITEVQHLVSWFCARKNPAKAVFLDNDYNELMDLTPDPADFVDFGEVCITLLGIQSQYGSRFLVQNKGCINFAHDLRLRGKYGQPLDATNYHEIEIHKDDVETFVERVLKFNVAGFAISEETADKLRELGMKRKLFTNAANGIIFDGERALKTVRSLMNDAEMGDDEGRSTIRRLMQLRPGERIALTWVGTICRMASSAAWINHTEG